jgi:hypothetical protein
MFSFSHLFQVPTKSDRMTVLGQSMPFHRQRLVLFVHQNAEEVDCCLQELKRAQFKVSSDTVLNLAQ